MTETLRCGAYVGTYTGLNRRPCGEPIRQREGGPRPVIFLDCDGVLNRAGTKERVGNFMGLDPELVSRARRVIEETGAEVVLSSAWRMYPEMLAAVAAEIPIIDTTTQVPGSRGQQINAWLAFHPERRERHAVIDDDRDMVDGLVPFFTEWETGITDEIADAVIAHLKPRWVHTEDGIEHKAVGP